MASVSFHNIKKSFGKTDIIHGISFDIRDGEFVVLVGPSGCGKSTLLRMLAGLEDITDGEIVIDNTPVNDLEAKDRDIAMVFQSYALYPHMTVRENMGFSLRLRKANAQLMQERVAHAARILNLAHGSFYALGAYGAYVLTTIFKVPLLVAAPWLGLGPYPLHLIIMSPRSKSCINASRPPRCMSRTTRSRP
ncbi:MAG: hypothetical protein RJA29_2156 [Pseudomonadota bacterium]